MRADYAFLTSVHESVASPWDALALPKGWRCNKNHDDDDDTVWCTKFVPFSENAFNFAKVNVNYRIQIPKCVLLVFACRQLYRCPKPLTDLMIKESTHAFLLM